MRPRPLHWNTPSGLFMYSFRQGMCLFLTPRFCRAELEFLFWRDELIVVTCKFLSKVFGNFSCEFFGLVFFPGSQAPQKPHPQNSRPKFSTFLQPKTFSFFHADLLLAGKTKFRARLRGQTWGDRLSPKHRFSQKTTDFSEIHPFFKESLLQNGFCTNFSDFDAKSCSPKNAPKNVPKNAPKNASKNGMFSPNISTEFFPNFRCVFFLQ